MKAPTETELLGELFHCERYLSLFPSGMPKRACLRRQLERQPAKDASGKARPLAEWPAPKPFCATECQVGRSQLQELRAAGVAATTCPSCGAALVGAGAAETCPGCEPDEAPRSGLQARPRVAPSVRIWTGEAPDVPLPGPEKTRAALGERPVASAGVRGAPPRRSVDATTPPPTAEEERTMPKEAKKGCPECGSPTMHKASCSRRPAARAATVKAPAAAAPRYTRGKQAEAGAPVVAAEGKRDLRAVTLDYLLLERRSALATVVNVDEELRRRQEEIARALGAHGGEG
jgi:hypothetical protein